MIAIDLQLDMKIPVISIGDKATVTTKLLCLLPPCLIEGKFIFA